MDLKIGITVYWYESVDFYVKEEREGTLISFDSEKVVVLLQDERGQYLKLFEVEEVYDEPDRVRNKANL